MTALLKNKNSGLRITRPVKSSETEIFVSDIHYPFADPAADELTRKLIAYIKPERLYLGGDIVDNHAVSDHKKSPFDTLRFAEELKEARAQLTRLRKAARNALVILREGNHDARLQFHLDTKAKELAALDELKLPNILRLEELGIEFVPEGTKELIGRLWHLHGHEIAGGGKYPARAKFAVVMANLICGHHHIFDSYVAKAYDDESRGVWTNATLLAAADYVHHDTSHLGVSVIKYVRGGFFEVIQVRYHEEGGVRFCVYNGRTFEAEIKRSE